MQAGGKQRAENRDIPYCVRFKASARVTEVKEGSVMLPSDILGVIIGILFIVPTIYLIRTKDWDKVAWPFFLITLPVYYMLFGVLAMDGTAILNEFLYGLPFIITGLLAWRMRSRAALLVVALAWLSHGFYDFYHDILFVNPGVFSWYPAFCAIVDVTVAGYLLLSYRKLTMQTA
jgi:hypothetical protein